MKSNIQDIKRAIKDVYRLSEEGKYLSIMVWGAPGVGKSAAVSQAAKELGIDFIDLRLSLLNPVDLRGLPSVNREARKAEWLPPEFLPREGKGILFLDEINLAPQSVMSAGYQLILDRKLGEYVLPEGWITVAAGNRGEDQAAVTRFPAPLANRFIHYEIDKPNHREWLDWAIGNGVHEQIAAFISKMPQHLYRQPNAGERAFSSPRSWVFASYLHSLGESIEPAVGGGVAQEFNAFLRVYEKLPSVEEILKGRVRECPKDLDILFALSNAIAYRITEKEMKDTRILGNVFEFLRLMPHENEVLTILSMAHKSPQAFLILGNSETFIKWSEEHKDSLKSYYEN